MDINTISLFATPMIRDIFNIVVKERNIRLRELRESLDLDREAVTESLVKLEAANLIKEKDAPVEDFKTFYVTADGLSAMQELRKLNLLS